MTSCDMIDYGDRTRTQAEVIRLFQKKYPELQPISQGTVKLEIDVSQKLYIGEFFEDRIISLNTQTIFSLRSCDLMPCYFLLWPYLINSIFETPAGDMENLQQRSVIKIEEINGTQWILQHVVNLVKIRSSIVYKEEIQQCMYTIFNTKYPDRCISQSTVSRIENKFREFGNVTDIPISGRKRILDDGEKLDILLDIQDNPHKPTRQVAADNDDSQTSILRLLKN
ncbi:hypothetical protein NQ318_001455 [Aromia moschata]|uniref:DUF4817 domain-containing protein n=1 Tax=Aromia moschata TaxID=1265417 RepID=A0AAV8YVS3_9CUCU|nr:hypothetical protein NQ318_001455 [Aromia moschata]